MQKIAYMLLIVFILCPIIWGAEKPITHNIWMPTGYNLNEGEFAIGIGPVNIGLSDRVQFGTNVLLFLFQDYNANVKVNVWNKNKMALAAGLDFNRYNLYILKEDHDFRYNTLSPFLSYSMLVGEKTNIHFAGKFDIFATDEDNTQQKIGVPKGSTLFMTGIEHSISNKTRLLFESGFLIGNPGIQLGGSVLFSWTYFRLKLGVSYFNPEGEGNGFTLPVIGLWWRFIG